MSFQLADQYEVKSTTKQCSPDSNTGNNQKQFSTKFIRMTLTNTTTFTSTPLS
jgi:hypothetical protein